MHAQTHQRKHQNQIKFTSGDFISVFKFVELALIRYENWLFPVEYTIQSYLSLSAVHPTYPDLCESALQQENFKKKNHCTSSYEMGHSIEI